MPLYASCAAAIGLTGGAVKKRPNTVAEDNEDVQPAPNWVNS